MSRYWKMDITRIMSYLLEWVKIFFYIFPRIFFFIGLDNFFSVIPRDRTYFWWWPFYGFFPLRPDKSSMRNIKLVACGNIEVDLVGVPSRVQNGLWKSPTSSGAFSGVVRSDHSRWDGVPDGSLSMCTAAKCILTTLSILLHFLHYKVGITWIFYICAKHQSVDL